MGIRRVFSYSLGPEAGVKPEQVRKDFSEFKIKGNQRAGYEVDQLITVMESIFQQTKMANIILVGMGNIGQALANYSLRWSGRQLLPQRPPVAASAQGQFLPTLRDRHHLYPSLQGP